MKARFNRMIRNLLLLLVLSAAFPAAAQESDGVFTVSGVVRELRTRQAIANVSVSVPETRIGIEGAYLS